MPRDAAASVYFIRPGFPGKRIIDFMDSFLAGLPHRPPFRFVDEVLAIEPGVSAAGRKTFPADEPFFAGHFPGNPIVPGVILTEALAQLAGIVAAAGRPGETYLLSAVRLMKFPRAVGPGVAIELHAKAAGELGGLLRFEVRAATGNHPVAEGEILLNRVASSQAP